MSLLLKETPSLTGSSLQPGSLDDFIVFASKNPVRLAAARAALDRVGMTNAMIMDSPEDTRLEGRPIKEQTIEIAARGRAQIAILNSEIPSLRASPKTTNRQHRPPMLAVHLGLIKLTEAQWSLVFGAYLNDGCGQEWYTYSSMLPVSEADVMIVSSPLEVDLMKLLQQRTGQKDIDPFKYYSDGDESEADYAEQAIRNVLYPFRNIRRYIKPRRRGE